MPRSARPASRRGGALHQQVVEDLHLRVHGRAGLAVVPAVHLRPPDPHVVLPEGGRGDVEGVEDGHVQQPLHERVRPPQAEAAPRGGERPVLERLASLLTLVQLREVQGDGDVLVVGAGGWEVGRGVLQVQELVPRAGEDAVPVEEASLQLRPGLGECAGGEDVDVALQDGPVEELGGAQAEPLVQQRHVPAERDAVQRALEPPRVQEVDGDGVPGEVAREPEKQLPHHGVAHEGQGLVRVPLQEGLLVDTVQAVGLPPKPQVIRLAFEPLVVGDRQEAHVRVQPGPLLPPAGVLVAVDGHPPAPRARRAVRRGGGGGGHAASSRGTRRLGRRMGGGHGAAV
mmetsp:Transcript_106050/g.300006  ORF Transcript_106050/g.300006 Transcript_106050/m.300006 type:complete len:342 (+) Transcript_106050:71-1096(+)